MYLTITLITQLVGYGYIDSTKLILLHFPKIIRAIPGDLLLLGNTSLLEKLQIQEFDFQVIRLIRWMRNKGRERERERKGSRIDKMATKDGVATSSAELEVSWRRYRDFQVGRHRGWLCFSRWVAATWHENLCVARRRGTMRSKWLARKLNGPPVEEQLEEFACCCPFRSFHPPFFSFCNFNTKITDQSTRFPSETSKSKK